MFTQTRVAVLRGGPSSEYDISLKTGAEVLSNLPEDCHGLDVFIDRSGAWHLHGKREAPHKILNKVDIVFNALHGEYGEDGGVQHLLEEHRIPFSGSGRLASALALHKPLAKQMLAKQGIRTPYFRLVRREESPDIRALAAELYRSFPQPCIVKPAARGSSLGVSLAREPEEIAYALELAFARGENVLVEEYMSGREVVCGSIEGFRGDTLYALLPVEVALPEGAPFYDYHAKYGGGARLSAPAALPPETKAELREAALLAHRALGLRHYSSSDFIVHPRRGIYFLEIDSLPSLLPNAPFQEGLRAVGSSLPDFLAHLIALARSR